MAKVFSLVSSSFDSPLCREEQQLLLLLSRFSRVRLCATPMAQPTRLPVPGILQARTLEWVREEQQGETKENKWEEVLNNQKKVVIRRTKDTCV